jgi:putative ABC transport system ATP-binding protein
MIQLKNINKFYKIGENNLQVLKNIDLEIKEKDFVAIMGQSGSGKSTLMNILGLLDICSSGSYFFDKENVENLNLEKQAEIRGEKIGFVFQSYNLISRIPVLKQVELPLLYQKVNPEKRTRLALQALKIMGLEDKINSLPNELSGGQQQRVSIARAIVTNPQIILADEPTGALDSNTSEEIMNIFVKLNQEGKTIILITHEQEIANYAKKIIRIVDGKII